MEAQELHRGRLIDHIQLVVSDLPASRRFYEAVFDTLKIPIGGTGRTTSGSMSCSFRVWIARPPPGS